MAGELQKELRACALGLTGWSSTAVRIATEAADALDRLEADKRELVEALKDAHTLIARARQYKGYGIGPLSEPWAEYVEYRASDTTAKHGAAK